jgi:hypothetical protein
MTLFAYTVTCDFVDEVLADAWDRWLREEHAADVCRAGALDAEIVRLDGAARIECRYHFASREDFARYEREHAPRLRAEGLARVPHEGAVRFTRSLGEVRFSRSRG